MKVEVEIDKKSGFCFGVTTAIKKAEEELSNGEILYCLGDIVHNDAECERLRQQGLVIINHEEFAQLHNAKVLLRAHGEPPETYERAKANNIQLIDATCPVVLRLQKRIKTEHEEKQPDAQLVIFGKAGHAEVLGLVGQTGGEAIVLEKPEDVKQLDFTRDIRLYSQTTKSLEGFKQIVDYIDEHIVPPATFQSYDTICRQVSNRLPNIQAFATQHDVVIFVSGLKSSNGRVLFTAAHNINPRTHMVDDPANILPEWFKPTDSVGICGATSTPKWLMEQCRERIANFEL